MNITSDDEEKMAVWKDIRHVMKPRSLRDELKLPNLLDETSSSELDEDVIKFWAWLGVKFPAAKK